MEAATAIDKALDVLFHLHGQVEPQGVSSIGRALGLPKSSTHRLLATLCRRELVEQDESGRYRLGLGLFGLALGLLENEPLVAAARPILEREVEALGETAFVVAARSGKLLVLDKLEGSGLLRASPRIGSTVPIHASAVGKLYLAHAPELLKLELPLARYTERTLVTTRALSRAALEARKAGHAVSRGEWIDGLWVAAAPVFRADQLAGALCVATASARVSRVDERTVIARIERAAAQVGSRLQGETP